MVKIRVYEYTDLADDSEVFLHPTTIISHKEKSKAPTIYVVDGKKVALFDLTFTFEELQGFILELQKILTYKDEGRFR